MTRRAELWTEFRLISDMNVFSPDEQAFSGAVPRRGVQTAPGKKDRLPAGPLRNQTGKNPE